MTFGAETSFFSKMVLTQEGLSLKYKKLKIDSNVPHSSKDK